MALTTVRPEGMGFNTGRRNLVINGAMKVAQRGTSSTSSNIQTVDRFGCTPVNFDNLAFIQSQSSTSPDGFSNSFGIEVTTAETALASDEHWYLATNFEAQNLQHLNYGSSSAKSLTLSFWVRSSLTGKYSVLFHQPDAGRSNTPSFNVNAADTWEYKTITIVGDTSGTINDDNGNGMTVHWVLAAGTDYAGTPHSDWGAYSATDDFAHSDNVDFSAQTGTFYLTGVQLEVGENASDFEHRSFGEELALCQRYYEKSYDVGTVPGGAVNYSGPYMSITSDSGSNATFTLPYIVSKRTVPTCTFYRDDGTSGGWQYYRAGVGSTNSAVTKHRGSENALNGYIGVGATFVPVTVYGHWTADAEL